MSRASLTEFAALVSTVRELRAKCPWDRKQTNRTLAKYLVEEAYEALDSAERGEWAALGDELGDLLAQILAQTVIAEEQASFTLSDLIRRARDKLVRRHPHVYGAAQAETADEVVEKWEQIKRDERSSAGMASAIDGIASSLPALMRAEKLGERARGAGMDWKSIEEVLGKVREELNEAEEALRRGDRASAAAEIGDMLLALGNAPRFLDCSAEETLRRACDKFADRFREVEKLAAARKVSLKELDAIAIDALWRETKESVRR